MSLKDLFVPKWKHSRTEVRLAAIPGFDKDILVLGEIAKTDVSPRVRMAAIRKLEDEAQLSAIIASERDNEVLECAKRCMETLLKKIISTSHDLPALIAALKKYDNEKVTAAYLCEHTLAIEAQRTLLGFIKSPHLRGKITEHQCAHEIAELIVQEISEKELLERIAEKASSKKIRSLAQNRVDVLFADPLAKEREIAKKLEQCCAGMDFSVTLQNLDQAVDLLDISQNLWNKYDPEQKHPLFAKYAHVKTILLERIEQCNVQKSVLHALDTVCLDAEGLVTEPADVLNDKIAHLQTAWAAVDGSMLDGLPLQKYHDRFTTAIKVLASRIETAKQETELQLRHQDALLQCCNELENYASGSSLLHDQNDHPLQTKWDSLCARGAPSAELQKRFDDAQKVCQEKRTAQAEAAKMEQQHEIEYVERLLGDMESISRAKPHHIGGLYREAVSIKREWEKPHPMARSRKKELESTFTEAYGRFTNAYQEFKEQESWQQWANEHVKEKILVEIEQFESQLAQDASFNHPSGRMSLFTSQWRRASGAGTDKSRELDKRFAEVCTRIFSLLLVQKTALLEALKTTLANESDHDGADKIKTIQKQWNDIGYLPPDLEKDLPETFYALCNTFFEERKEQYQKYNEALQTNSALRDEICTEAEQAATSTDWKTTRETFSQLQKRWDEAWPAPQKNMREQWLRFSKSRDHFFEQYDAFKTENDGIKEALCEQATHLLAQCETAESPVDPVSLTTDTSTESVAADEFSPVNYGRILNEAIDLQRSWKESGPASKTRSEELWQRFNASINKIFAIINKEHSDNFVRKEALVKEAEELAASEAWDAASQRFSDIRLAWKEIRPAARRDEQVLWNRLQKAGDTFFTRRRAHFDALKGSLQQQIDERERLLAEMELLVRLAGKSAMLTTSATQSAAEILKKGIDLREKLVVDDDPQKTYNNIKKRAFEIIDIWERGETLNSKAAYQLDRRFDELLRILRG